MAYKILFLFLLLANALDAGAAPVQVKLGFVSDLTGIGAYWGTQAQRGLELARHDIGLQGGVLDLVVADHTFKPIVALSEAQKLINLDKVDALWVEFAPTAVATSDVAARAHKLFINNSAATSLLKTNPYAFKAYLDYERGCKAIAHFWKSRGLLKVGMLKLNGEFAELCLRGALAEYPKLMVLSYDFGESVSSQILRMKSKGMQAVLNPGLEVDTLNTFKAMREINYHVPVGISEPDGLSDQVRMEYSDMLEGVTTFGFPRISDEFKSKFRARFPAAPTDSLEGAAMAYTHALQIYSAFQSCPDRDVDCVVKQMSVSPPNPTLQFLRWESHIAVYDFTLKEWHNNELIPVLAGI